MKAYDLAVGNLYTHNNYPGEVHKYIGILGSDELFSGQHQFAPVGKHLGLICTDEQLSPIEPVKTKVKTKDKPRVKLLNNGRRQFDVAFKLMVVREVKRLRLNKDNPMKTHGGSFLCYNQGIKKYIASINLGVSQVYYWITQFDQGHFSSERAVAFSRKKTMMHG